MTMYLKGDNYCDKSNYTFQSEEVKITEDERRTQIILYKLLCPPLIFACLVSVALNVALIIVGRLGTTKKSPILILSLNLACTDTIASLLNGLGFVFNSYLPVVFNVHFETCPFLAAEIVRSSALISSVLHLLALAFIHYKGIVRPLHYRVRTFFSHHVTRSIHLISAICWGIPLTAFTVYFYSIPCQGFRSKNCDYRFLASKRYRLFILAFFLIPLVLMLFLYTRIFRIIRQNQRMRYQSNHGFINDQSKFPKAAALLIQNGAQASTSPKHIFIFRHSRKQTASSTSSVSSSLPIVYDPPPQLMETSIDPSDSLNNNSNIQGVEGAIFISSSTTTNSTSRTVKQVTSSSTHSNGAIQIQSQEILQDKPTTLDEKVSNETPVDHQSINSNQYHHKLLSTVKDNRLATIGPTRSNTKALITSLLILGTYLLCWLPAVTFLVLTCLDGCPFSLTYMPKKITIIISSICNFLVILKAIVDPFIYIFRTREVKLAIRRIFNSNQRNDGSRFIRSTVSGSTNDGSTTPNHSNQRNLHQERIN